MPISARRTTLGGPMHTMTPEDIHNVKTICEPLMVRLQQLSPFDFQSPLGVKQLFQNIASDVASAVHSFEGPKLPLDHSLLALLTEVAEDYRPAAFGQKIEALRVTVRTVISAHLAPPEDAADAAATARQELRYRYIPAGQLVLAGV